MKKVISINNKTLLMEAETEKEISYSVLANNQIKPLISINKEDGIITKFKSNKYYIIIYTCGQKIYGNPPTIQLAYDITNDQILDIENNHNLLYALENMFIYAQNFTKNIVLQAINKADLHVAKPNAVLDFFDYMKNYTEEFTDEQVVAYLLNTYPILKRYSHISRPLTFNEYHDICDALPEFYINSMPQNLDSVINKPKTLEKKNNGD